MNASSPPSDAGRELNELRRRVYGPHPDSQDDPAALARLTELEAARTPSLPEGADTKIDEPAVASAGAPMADFAWTRSGADWSDSAPGTTPSVPNEGSPRSLRHRTTATRTRRNRFVAGALVAFLALAYTVQWLAEPHPGATLEPIAEDGDRIVFQMLDVIGADVDPSSLRGYEPYRGVEPWFAVDKQGFQCFMIINRSGPWIDGANCVPPGVDLFADIGVWPQLGEGDLEGLPAGSIIRFHYRGDSVDAYLYPASEAE